MIRADDNRPRGQCKSCRPRSRSRFVRVACFGARAAFVAGGCATRLESTMHSGSGPLQHLRFRGVALQLRDARVLVEAIPVPAS
jgi:hypothetical protein